jgi:FkbM family methyltransferase
LWYSNAPWVASGYGQQTALFVPRLQKMGHEVAVAAFHGLHGAPMEWNGIRVLPGSAEDIWAQDIMLGHYQRHQADLCITLMDQWVLDPNKTIEMKNLGVRFAHWTPVDCEPLGQMDERNFRMTGNQPIAISRHGEKMMQEFSPFYVPHGVDTTVFRPDPELRAKTREHANFDGKIIIGINAANQDPVRKGFGEQFAAFRLFHDKYPESRLLVHTRRQSRSGSDLDRLIRLLHLEDAIEFGDQYLTVTGLTSPEVLNQWYNVLDVFSSCSYGEGFGIPVLEAQAAGTPVSVTDCSALTELCGAGWKVDGDFYWNAGHGAWWTKPFIRAIADAWEQALYRMQQGTMDELRLQAREFALGYDADLVAETYWKPVLEQMSGPRTVEHAGLKWVLGDSVDHGDRLGPVHEETVEDKVLDLLPAGGVMLDVGAHVGHYALRAASKAAAVIAIECNPATAARLQENLAVNEITNVAVHQVAAWDKVERLKMESRDGFERSGDTRVSPDEDGTVTGMPLDRILKTDRRLKEHNRLDLVKLDVEGADLHALRGMAQTLAKYRPVMVIEDHSVYGCYERSELEALLAELGYSMSELAMYGCAPYLLAEPVPATVPA